MDSSLVATITIVPGNFDGSDEGDRRRVSRRLTRRLLRREIASPYCTNDMGGPKAPTEASEADLNQIDHIASFVK